MDKPATLGEWLLHLRKRADMTQIELRDASTVSQAAISEYELGHTVPRGDNLQKLLKALNATDDEKQSISVLVGAKIVGIDCEAA